MKKITLLFTSLLLFLGFTTSCMSISNSSNYSAAAQGTYRGSVPFVFIEHGVEFAIYPNGEFDFAYVGIDYRHNPYNDLVVHFHTTRDMTMIYICNSIDMVQ